MESKESRKCSICRQFRPANYFLQTTDSSDLLAKANICLLCRKASALDEEDDEGGSGGKQQKKDAKHQQQEIELEAIRQKELTDLNHLEHEKDLFGVAQRAIKEQKNQAAQRELLDKKEGAPQELEPNNPDYTEDTKVKRDKNVRLFSVTQLLTSNYRATNNINAILRSSETNARQRKNIGLFSQANKDQAATHKLEQEKRTKTSNHTLSSESSTLFSQPHPTTEAPPATEAEQLATLIRDAQKNFNR